MGHHDEHQEEGAREGVSVGDTTVTEADEQTVGAPGTGPAGVRTEGTTQVDSIDEGAGSDEDAARTS